LTSGRANAGSSDTRTRTSGIFKTMEVQPRVGPVERADVVELEEPLNL
jgi:hypothetical protein